MLVISVIFPILLTLAGCATQSADMRGVKLAWQMPKCFTSLEPRPSKVVIHYGYRSRYGRWDEKCADVDNFLYEMQATRQNGLDLEFEKEKQVISDCPVGLPYEFKVEIDAADSPNGAILKLPKGVKYYAAVRILGTNGMYSRFTDEVEIPAQ